MRPTTTEPLINSNYYGAASPEAAMLGGGSRMHDRKVTPVKHPQKGKLLWLLKSA